MQIRELLEKLLDDDEDMRDMNLSARSVFIRFAYQSSVCD